MIRLRFVEEYRGRRIVTNGELYGIQGELVTDCRYLNGTGARAAIDSETNAAVHRAYVESQRRHFADLLEETGEKYAVGCQCGWRGRADDLKREKRDATVMRCPMCSSNDVYLIMRPPASVVTGPRKRPNIDSIVSGKRGSERSHTMTIGNFASSRRRSCGSEVTTVARRAWALSTTEASTTSAVRATPQS